jgi:hypothetical protein
MPKKITAFAGVFEQRLNLLKRDLKKELQRAKSDRQKERIKKLIRECKDMRDLVKELKPKCPHCGGTL